MTLYSQQFGTGDVMAVLNGVDTVGQAAILTTAGPDSDEDFLSQYQGTVASVYANGLVSSVVDQTWPSDGYSRHKKQLGGGEQTRHGPPTCHLAASRA